HLSVASSREDQVGSERPGWPSSVAGRQAAKPFAWGLAGGKGTWLVSMCQMARRACGRARCGRPRGRGGGRGAAGSAGSGRGRRVAGGVGGGFDERPAQVLGAVLGQRAALVAAAGLVHAWAQAGGARELLGTGEPGDVAQPRGGRGGKPPGDAGGRHQQRHVLVVGAQPTKLALA